MKFTIGKEAFLEGLQQVQHVVGSRTTLPILSNVLIEAENGGLRMTTTDLDVRVTGVVPAEVQKEGKTTLPVKRLVSIISALPSADIEVSVDGKEHASIRSGPSFFKIIGLETGEFPEFPDSGEVREYKISQRVLKDSLRKISYAISSDETRYVLTGAYIAFAEGKMTLVATDGRRLAMVENDLEFPAGHEATFVLPNKAVRELGRLLTGSGEVNLRLSPKDVTFEIGDSILVSKLIEGAYPNYRQVIPGEARQRLTVSREALLATAQRVALLSSDKSNSVRLNFQPGQLEVMANTPDVGEAKESLDVKYDGETFAIAFNPEFLIAPLRHLEEDEVHLDLIDEMSPGVLRTEGSFLYVLMPMRVTN